MIRSTHDQQSLEHGRAGLPVYIAAGCRAQVPADRYETQDRSSLRARAGFFDVYAVSPMTRGFIVISSHWPGGGARHFSSFSFASRSLGGRGDRRPVSTSQDRRAATLTTTGDLKARRGSGRSRRSGCAIWRQTVASGGRSRIIVCAAIRSTSPLNFCRVIARGPHAGLDYDPPPHARVCGAYRLLPSRHRRWIAALTPPGGMIRHNERTRL